MLMAEIFHVTKIQMLVYMYVLPCSLYWNSMLWTFFGLFFHFTYTLTIHVCLLYYIYLTGGYLVIIAEGQIPIEVGRILPPSRWAIPLDISNPRCGRAQPFLTDPYLWEHFYLSGRNQMSQGGSRALHLFGPLWNPPDSISKRWQKMLVTWHFTQQYTMPVSKIWWHWNYIPDSMIYPIHLWCQRPLWSSFVHYCPCKLWLILGIL